jgi:ZIP family zinc transporter
MVIFISFGAFVFTLLGGFFALHYRDKLHLILGFSAGAVIGVAFFDLMPEAINLASVKYDTVLITSLMALGFIIYLLLDRFVATHTHNDENCQNESHRGKLGAGSLSLHSFLDGMIIGLAFKVSVAVGAIVTIAVLVHDFSDGVNTVSMILKNGGSREQALKWLLVDAVAPILGVASTYLFTLKSATLGMILALFCGFFIYIGASDLLPESHHRHPTYWTTVATIFGIVILYVAIRIASL